MPESIAAVLDALPYLLQGVLITVVIVAGAMALGLTLGIPLAVGQVYGLPWVRAAIAVYVWFFRGIPLLVFLFLFYFGLCTLLDINLSAFTVAIVVLGLVSAAYQSQIFRGAILSLPVGQLRAARAIGMSDTQSVVHVILPQALRLSIPGWSNEYSIVLKDSAVTYALGVAEVMARAHFVATRTYEHMPLYITAGMIFLMLTWLGVRGLRRLEEKVRIPGYAHQEW